MSDSFAVRRDQQHPVLKRQPPGTSTLDIATATPNQHHQPGELHLGQPAEWLGTLDLTGSIGERQEARALASQSRDVAWTADDTAWQRVLRAISGGRWGRQPTGWAVIRLDAPWQGHSLLGTARLEGARREPRRRCGVRRRLSGFDGRCLRQSQHAHIGGRALARLGHEGGASTGLVDLDDLDSLPAQEPCQGSSVGTGAPPHTLQEADRHSKATWGINRPPSSRSLAAQAD